MGKTKKNAYAKNKGADQLRGSREADQRLCFRYTDSTIHLLPKYEIPCFYLSSVTVQSGLCRTWSEPKLLVFSRTCSYKFHAEDLPLKLIIYIQKVGF